MDILDRIHKNMYGLHLLNEVTQFVDQYGRTTNRFEELYKRIISAYPDEKNLYQDFYNKLLEFLKQDQSNKFKISYFDKKQFPKLIDIIHKLDNFIAEINQLKGIKISIKPDIKGIPKVYENRELGITVYRADNVFQAIELGKGTNFCISVGLNGHNHYYGYKYDEETGDQKATIYFVHSSNQEDPNKVLAIDYLEDGDFLYTNTTNRDKDFTSFNQMVNDGYTSPDLKIIPEVVFKWVDQPMSGLSDIELNEIVKFDGRAIQYIKNPTESTQLAAVNSRGDALQYIKNPSEEVQLAAIRTYGNAIQYIKNPSEEVQLAAISTSDRYDDDHNVSLIMAYIKKPSKAVILAAIQLDYTYLRYIENPSEELQLAAVNKHGYAIRYIKKPSEKVQLAAVSENGYAIDYINNPSETVQLAAVKQNPESIKVIKNPSEAVKVLAKQNTLNNDQDGPLFEMTELVTKQIIDNGGLIKEMFDSKYNYELKRYDEGGDITYVIDWNDNHIIAELVKLRNTRLKIYDIGFLVNGQDMLYMADNKPSSIKIFGIIREVLSKEIDKVDYAIFMVTQDYGEHKRINIYQSLLGHFGYKELASSDFPDSGFDERMKIYIFGKNHNTNNDAEIQKIIRNPNKYLQ